MLRDAIAGNERAFDALIGPLVEPGYRLAASMLEHREEAEDAVQEATIKAWRNLNQLKDAEVTRSWFFTIVANQCRTVRRGRSFSFFRRTSSICSCSVRRGFASSASSSL